MKKFSVEEIRKMGKLPNICIKTIKCKFGQYTAEEQMQNENKR